MYVMVCDLGAVTTMCIWTEQTIWIHLFDEGREERISFISYSAYLRYFHLLIIHEKKPGICARLVTINTSDLKGSPRASMLRMEGNKGGLPRQRAWVLLRATESH